MYFYFYSNPGAPSSRFGSTPWGDPTRHQATSLARPSHGRAHQRGDAAGHVGDAAAGEIHEALGSEIDGGLNGGLIMVSWWFNGGLMMAQ